MLALPNRPNLQKIELDGKLIQGTVQGARRRVVLPPGLHSGSF